MRGLTVAAAQRETILGCGDLEQLARWLRRSVVASSVEEVTAEP